ncbi:histamine H2 receptor-like [Oculina patagonica]
MKINFTSTFNSCSFVKNNSGKDLFQPNGYSEQELNCRIAICLINVILALVALFGNSTILLTIWKTRSLHSVANILLSSLAVSDLAVGLLVQPLFIIGLLSGNIVSKEIYTLLVLGDILEVLLCIVSSMTISAIAIDRLLTLLLHLRYHTVVTPFRVTVVVIFIWIISGISASVRSWNLSLFYSIPPVSFISLVVVNFVVYFKIYLIVRRHQKQIQQQQQQRNNIFRVKRFKKTALNTFLVCILLLCCYMPYSIVYKMSLAGLNFSPSVYFTVITLIFLNSSLNPLLYCWRDRAIRTAIKQVLLCR